MPSPSRRRLVFAQSSRLAVVAEFRAVETTYATYTVTATEAGREWRHPVRWSDLRRLHDELQRSFGEALRKQEIPTFWPHTLRLGSARLSPSFCAARASEMQSYLSALVEALGVSLVDGIGPAILRAFLAQGCDVEQPTPIDRWYTPEAGWPGVAWAGEERLAPCSLTPTGLAATALPGESLGELRVEILQATGLERSDLYSQNDVYALFLYERACAQTTVLEDAQHPRWQPEDGRAARFALTSPHAALHVALFDADFSAIDDDEPLGRCVLEVMHGHCTSTAHALHMHRTCTLHMHCVHNRWFG